jgi:hypothetical protein
VATGKKVLRLGKVKLESGEQKFIEQLCRELGINKGDCISAGVAEACDKRG